MADSQKAQSELGEIAQRRQRLEGEAQKLGKVRQELQAAEIDFKAAEKELIEARRALEAAEKHRELGIKMETSSNIIRGVMVTGMGSAGIVTGAGTSGNFIYRIGGEAIGNAGAGIVVGGILGFLQDVTIERNDQGGVILTGESNKLLDNELIDKEIRTSLSAGTATRWLTTEYPPPVAPAS